MSGKRRRVGDDGEKGDSGIRRLTVKERRKDGIRERWDTGKVVCGMSRELEEKVNTGEGQSGGGGSWGGDEYEEDDFPLRGMARPYPLLAPRGAGRDGHPGRVAAGLGLGGHGEESRIGIHR